MDIPNLYVVLGGRDHACVAQGPHQKLLCPSDTMAHLPVRLPHRNQAVKERLSLPAAGKDWSVERMPFTSQIHN